MFLPVVRLYQAPRRNFHLVKIAFAVTAAAAVVMTAPLLVGTTSAKAQNLKMAQGVDVQLGRDRDRDRRRGNDSDVTIGVGPGGVTVGPRRNCRMVTTTVERDDGRTTTTDTTDTTKQACWVLPETRRRLAAARHAECPMGSGAHWV
jgi:hypothetical protein